MNSFFDSQDILDWGIESAGPEVKEYVENLKQRISTLEVQLVEARKDGERLDWLQENATLVTTEIDAAIHWYDIDSKLQGDEANLREAIDAAARKEPV